MRRSLIAAMMTPLLLGPALAHELEVGPFRISHPWTHASPAGATAAPLYMSITLTGESADRLIGASSPVADRVEFHRHTRWARHFPRGHIIPGGDFLHVVHEQVEVLEVAPELVHLVDGGEDVD